MAELSDIANPTIREEIEEFLERADEIERNVELFARTRPLMQEIAVGIIDGDDDAVDRLTVQALAEGIDAMGEVTVRLQAENGSIHKRTSPQNGQVRRRTFGGYGADTDIIVASAKAYLAALNKLLIATGKYRTGAVHPQQSTISLNPEGSQS